MHTANCLEIWEIHPVGTLRSYSGLYRDLLTFLSSCESRGIMGPNVGTGMSDRKIWFENEGREISVAAFR